MGRLHHSVTVSVTGNQGVAPPATEVKLFQVTVSERSLFKLEDSLVYYRNHDNQGLVHLPLSGRALFDEATGDILHASLQQQNPSLCHVRITASKFFPLLSFVA